MRLLMTILLAGALCGAPGCAKKAVNAGSAEAPLAGEQAKAGSFLAYEHTVRIDLDEGAIGGRVDAVREACGSERFGSCSLLSAELKSGRHIGGEVVVRIAPAGVEPLVRFAADGGAIQSHTTYAKDLAQVVADNARQRELLTRQRAKLEEFQARKDLAVADMLALTRELASLEVQLDAVEQQSAQQRLHIETNRLAIQFRATDESTQESRVFAALKGLWGSLNEGLADAVEYAGYVLPFLLLGFPLLLVLRWLWRRATRSRA